MAAIAKGQREGASGRRLSAFLFRHPGVEARAVARRTAHLAPRRLHRLARCSCSRTRSGAWTSSPREIVRGFSFDNFQTLWESGVYRTITIRTVGIAAAVTITDIVLSFPLAYYAARLATPRDRNALLVAVVLPLWANYLVRVFAWKIMLTPNGFVNWLAELTGLGSPPARELELGGVAHVRLPVAPVHAPADLRGARARAGLVPGGVVGSGREGLDDVPQRDVPADPARASPRARSSRSRSRSATTSRRSWSGTRSSSAT